MRHVKAECTPRADKLRVTLRKRNGASLDEGATFAPMDKSETGESALDQRSVVIAPRTFAAIAARCPNPNAVPRRALRVPIDPRI